MMKYYKDKSTSEIYAYESDGSQDSHIKLGLVLMSRAEVEKHLQSTRPSLKDFREIQVFKINQEFEESLGRSSSRYTSSEKMSWDTQKREANSWEEDHKAQTPFLDSLAKSRGISREEMINATLKKIKAFDALHVKSLGTLQKLRAKIDQAKTISEIESITWPKKNS